MRADEAETVALGALGWIAGDDDRLARFLAATGTDPRSLADRATEPEMLAAVLDFVLSDEASVLGFCAAAGLPPESPQRARAALPGGGEMHWT